ncbi:hypothetical protein AAZX31_13G218800 [Glycine max]|uniref:Uncharacterized protein n=2 Tax=Glycine subgen. Soja TaxID=1462606 RepID=K7M1H2_SOYBN|nr:hypothetical protein GYH30_037165 [Glycine max]KHN08495.1 hypothetical protein glysoja_014260 [Glycine soja]KRH21371.1 hypothetical protein GLYMA_13G236000v4 [Glycine max]RZB82516.1 hypothetical protein D0Y65_031591 [Glycine soja]
MRGLRSWWDTKTIAFGAHSMCLPCFVYLESEGPRARVSYSIFLWGSAYSKSVSGICNEGGGKVESTCN